MANMTPWQLLLWIVAIGMTMVPLISILVTTIITGYFNAREKFYYRMASNFSKAIRSALEAMINEIKKRKNDEASKTDDSNPNS